MAGVEKTLETVADVKAIALDAVSLAKAYGKGALGIFAVLTGIVGIVGDAKELIADAPLALPELKDLDVAEAEQVGVAAYDCVKSIVEALAAP